MNTDIIIIGQGLAGSILALHLLEHGLKVLVYDDGVNHSSSVAAGLYHPYTGRRIVQSWKASTVFSYLETFYENFSTSQQLGCWHPMPLYRIFENQEQQNDWGSIKLDDPGNLFIKEINTRPYLPGILKNPYGGILFSRSGYVEVKEFLSQVKKILISCSAFLQEKFDEKDLQISKDEVKYRGCNARKIIYCQGIAAGSSRYFRFLPFRPVKGEILTLEMDLDIDKILIFGHFLIPLGNGLFRLGATYDRENINTTPENHAKNALLNKLNKYLSVKYRVVDHCAGIRPATADRRPFIGFHPDYKHIGIFNGFGSKGVSLIPWFAMEFTRQILHGNEVDREAEIFRFFYIN